MAPPKKKRKGLQRVQKPQTNPSKGPSSANPSTSSPTNTSLQSTTNPSTKSVMNPAADPSTGPSTDPPKNPSNDHANDPARDLTRSPSKNPSNDTSTDLTKSPSKNPSKDPIRNPPKNLTQSFPVPPRSLATTFALEISTNPPFYLHEDAFHIPAYDHDQVRSDTTGGYTLSWTHNSMPQTNYDMEQYELGNVERIEDWPTNYPIMELLVHRSIPYFYAVDTFVANFPISSKNFGYVEEVDRVQQLLDEFGKTDPEITPTVIVDLFNAGFVYEITKRLIHWAILSNLEADGDTRNTLLPPRVVALYREIDSQETKEHQILLRKWFLMTFGLLKEGYSRFAKSEEWRPSMDRIKRFLLKLIGPHCREVDNSGESISRMLDKIFMEAIPFGYLLFGHFDQYRWHWNWPRDPDYTGIIKPKPKKPKKPERPKSEKAKRLTFEEFKELQEFEEPERVVPLVIRDPKAQKTELNWRDKGVLFVTSPALIRVTDHVGALLDDPITCISAKYDTLERSMGRKLSV